MGADPREGKLPAWARSNLAAGRRRIADLEQMLAAQLPSEPTTIVVEPYSEAARHLPPGAHLRYFVAGVDEPRQFIDIHLDDNGDLIVQGSHPLVIRPIVTNHLLLALADRP